MWRRLVLAAVWILAAGPAVAQEAKPDAGAAPGNAILVVDFNQIVQESAAARDVDGQLQVARQAAQKEFDGISQDLMKAQEELTSDRATLTPEQYDQKFLDFQRRYVDAQNAAEARKAALTQAEDRAMRQIRGTLRDVVTEIAGERKAQMVLNRIPDTIVIVDQRLDITQDAQARLDARLPKVAVVIPQP